MKVGIGSVTLNLPFGESTSILFHIVELDIRWILCEVYEVF